ncbi:MAG: flagellar basal body-associated FliL family protein [Pseudomonadota bacterium]
MKKGREHNILIYRANGTWQSQIRKEGRLGRVVTKQEEFLGTWTVSDGFLSMTATQAIVGDTWKIGETISFEIVEIAELTMQLKKPNGTIETWVRVKSQKTEGKESIVQALSFKPIVVNLSKEKAGSKDHYLCIELEFVLKSVMPEGTPLPDLHPKVREAIVFYLSSLTYAEVNTMDKVAGIKNNLLQLVNPYSKDQIENISIRNITVTSRWDSVEAFLSQYKDASVEAQKNNGEKAQKED